jgi:hypothetical protein
MTPRPTTGLFILLESHHGFPPGTLVQTAYRPEYGESLRMVATRLPDSGLYENVRDVVFAHPAFMADASRTFVTQEDAVFDMAGATCPNGHDSDLAHKGGAAGYFTCPTCGVVYDEPTFGEADYLTTIGEDSDA